MTAAGCGGCWVRRLLVVGCGVDPAVATLISVCIVLYACQTHLLPQLPQASQSCSSPMLPCLFDMCLCKWVVVQHHKRWTALGLMLRVRLNACQEGL